MQPYVTSDTIKKLRENLGYTQKQLADMLCISDKTISKWETSRGLPDISLLEPLALSLKVSVAELLSGNTVQNKNRAANMQKGNFYVCPVCSNIIRSCGEGAFSCCGISLPPLESEAPDSEHDIIVERVENEYCVTLSHEMTKTHYISFIAYVTSERVNMVKLYPQQDALARFLITGRGRIYAYCNHHGLFVTDTPR